MKTKKISALIFSINEYELVRNQIKLIYPYVDEIVIIDSSTDKTQKRLMKNLEKKYKKVRVVWLPPIGIADFYYKIGINECKYEWIFQLDADDIPSEKLLKDLRKLVNDKYDAYKIYRDYDRYYLFRLYKKSIAAPFCLIHYVMSIKGKNYLELSSKEYYIHSPLTFRGYKNKLYKYSLLDSYQQFFKLYIANFFASFNKDGYSFPQEFFITYKISNVFLLFSKSYLLSMLVWTFYNTLSFMYSLLSAISKFEIGKSFGILYTILIFLNVLKSPYKRFLPIRLGYKSFCEFLELYDKKLLLKNAKRLNFGNVGIENLKRLYDYRILKSYEEYRF
ncbi:MAG: glycosyltransferase [Candidatus Aenigmatarchaeota archaeon]